MTRRHSRFARHPAGCKAWARNALLLAAWALGTCLGLTAHAQDAAAGSAAALHAKRAELQAQLRASAFGEPLVLGTRALADRYEGDVYGEVAHPFSAVAAQLRNAAGLCELLFLHLNVRGCTPAGGSPGAPESLTLLVGPKRAGAMGMQYSLQYSLRTEVAGPNHLRVSLSAAQGPLSTRDYRMVFEAVPIDGGHSFVHFGYAYGFGLMARLTMGAYLGTAGRDKIGFSSEGVDADGKPAFVRGERGALERNVMRYYLALLAQLSTAPGNRAEQQQARLRTWFALTERYAPQLHEYDLAEYLQEKRDQLAAAGTPR